MSERLEPQKCAVEIPWNLQTRSHAVDEYSFSVCIDTAISMNIQYPCVWIRPQKNSSGCHDQFVAILACFSIQIYVWHSTKQKSEANWCGLRLCCHLWFQSYKTAYSFSYVCCRLSYLAVIFHSRKVSSNHVISPSPHGHLTRFVELRVAHALGMSGTFSPPPTSLVSDPGIYHGTWRTCRDACRDR